MSFGTKKKSTPRLVDALWDFIRADTPKKIKHTEKKLKVEWRRKGKQ